MTLADTFDTKAKALSDNLKKTESELLELLIQMKRKSLFAELGYSGIYNYCEGALKLSPAQSHYFKKVAEKSEEVPELKAAIDRGQITLSQARRIVPVLNQSNQSEWIEKAAALKQRELEQAVTVANPEARIPTEKINPITPQISELKIALTVEEEKEIRRVQDLLSTKMRKPVGLKEALVLLAQNFLRKQDPVERAEKLVNRKPIATLPQRPGRQPIRKTVLHEVNTRDKGQCAFVAKDGTRCRETRWTELHHKVPVSLGGRNVASNLATLCSYHHRYQHRRLH